MNGVIGMHQPRNYRGRIFHMIHEHGQHESRAVVERGPRSQKHEDMGGVALGYGPKKLEVHDIP